MGEGSEDNPDFFTIESDKLLEETKYSNFNKDYYVKTGKALLCANDIKTSFVRGTVLNYEASKYIYSYKISEEQLKQNKKIDFMIEMNEKDNITIYDENQKKSNKRNK